MPQNSSKGARSSTPPPVMTWRKASLVLVLAGLFDVVRAFFQFFWFFGPALAAVYCTMKASGILSTWTLGILGAKTAAVLCAGAGVAAGAAAIAATAPLGVIMADAVGLVGFLTIGLIIIMTNARILKTISTAPLQFAGAFAVGEIPFLGALPVFSFTLWKLYRTQIHAEAAAFQKWEKEHAAELDAERKRNAAQLAHATQEAQAAQINEQESANEAILASEEAEADDEIRKEDESANDADYGKRANE